MKESLSYVKEFGGRTILIGNYPGGKKLQIDPWNIIKGASMEGAWLDKDPFDKMFKKLQSIINNKKYDVFFGKKIYKLNDMSIALRDFENGKVIRPLIAL